MKRKKIMKYELWFGKFEHEDLAWKIIKNFDNYEDAYKYYKKFVNEQFNLDNDELIEEHDSTRLDIELRSNNKKINWIGIYAKKEIDEEEKEEQ